MQKILAVAIAISLNMDVQMAALADTYDDFMKTQIAEFQPNPGDAFKCKHKKIEQIGTDLKRTYDLCVFKGKPVTLEIYTDGAALDSIAYRNGKLVQMALSEFGDGVGFRNGQPVVEWHSGEYGKRGINWNITATEKASYLDSADRQRRILRKFGIR
jgi:hypothetical protein